MAFAANEDYIALALINDDGTLAESYVGPCTTDSNNLVTITDERSGGTFQVYFLPGQDDSGTPYILLTQDGETGFALYQADVNDTLSKMAEIGVPVA